MIALLVASISMRLQLLYKFGLS